MAIHELKTWPEPFQAIREGVKAFELRRDDRAFEVGDMLVLREWDTFREIYTGRAECRFVTYKLDGGAFGLPEGFCIMSLATQPTPETP